MKSIDEIFAKNNSKQYLSFLILSNSLKYSTPLTNYILDFDNSEHVKLFITPTNNPHIKNILSEYNFITPEYKEINHGIACIIDKAKNNKSFCHGVSFHFTENNIINPLGELTKWDLLYFQNHEFDFFIVDDPNLYSEKHETIVNVKEALEYLRLFLLKHEFYEVSPHFSIDRFIYYLYLNSKIFPYFSKIFSIAIEANIIPLLELLQSLNSRLTFLQQTLDHISFIILSKPTINSMDSFLYYFSYLIMISTGILDDFAHIFNLEYNCITNNQRTKITLRVYNNKEKSDFSEGLRKNNKHDLASYIESIDFKYFINLIYLLRDKVQHQKFLTTGKYYQYNIEIKYDDLFTINNIQRLQDYDLLIKREDEYFLNSIVFIKHYKNHFIKIINSLFPYIKIDKYLESMEIDKIEMLNDKYKILCTETWKYYNLSLKPYLLDFMSE